MNIDPTVRAETGNELDERIIVWMDELARPCQDARKSVLAEKLARALEGIMGIERDMLASILLNNAPQPVGHGSLSPSLSFRF